MSANTKYILDAIKKTGPNTLVKVFLNGGVTEIQAKLAIEQLHKPIKERRGSYSTIAPFEEVPEAEELTYENFMREITAPEPVIEEIAEPTISDSEIIAEVEAEVEVKEEEHSEEEIVEPKKKKKQNND